MVVLLVVFTWIGVWVPTLEARYMAMVDLLLFMFCVSRGKLYEVLNNLRNLFNADPYVGEACQAQY
jgi:hypothetical protein